MNPATARTTSVGRIHTILHSLIEERGRLQASGHDPSLLEANRMAIVYWRSQLDRSRAGANGTPRA